MIYVTGDTHGEYQRLSSRFFPEQKSMNKNDYVIICGDFGIWRDDKEHRYWMDWLENRPFTTLFADGNHENFDMLSQMPAVCWNGGLVHAIRPSVLHLMRGQGFLLRNRRVFVMGGAASHDIKDGILEPDDPDLMRKKAVLNRRGKTMYRINHVSWWKEEMPSEEEYAAGLETLQKWDWKTDYLITHCAPQSLEEKIVGERTQPNRLTEYLEEINTRCRFKYWFFGHYHDNRKVTPHHICLYEQVVKVCE